MLFHLIHLIQEQYIDVLHTNIKHDSATMDKSSGLKTPVTPLFTIAGLQSGPKILNILHTPNSFLLVLHTSLSDANFGANKNVILICSRHCSIVSIL